MLFVVAQGVFRVAMKRCAERTTVSGVPMEFHLSGGFHERIDLSGGFGGCDHRSPVLLRNALMSTAGGVVTDAEYPPSVQWSAVAAGAVIAAGISFTLLSFGAAIGLSVASTAPTWRDSSPWLWLLSGIFLVFVALSAFGFGGYVTARMRRAMPGPETEHRDGLHGVLAWALAILITAVLALGGAALVAPAAAPSSGSMGPATSVAGENIIASELDALFRTDRPLIETDLAYRRAEAARILLKSGGHSGIPLEDRAYLSDVVANHTGLSVDEAATRTDRVIANSANELYRARAASVLQAFLIGAALLLGAAVAWFAAVEGGRERDTRTPPVWDWSWRRRFPARSDLAR